MLHLRNLLLCVSLMAGGIASPPLFAQVNCPTADDIKASGVRLTRSTPLFDTRLTLEGDLVVEDRVQKRPNQPKERIVTRYAGAVFPVSRRSQRGSLAFRYDKPVPTVAALVRARRWSSPITLFVNRQAQDAGTIQARFLGRATWTSASGCSYKVERIRVTTNLQGFGKSHHEYLVSQELGISLLSYKLGKDGRSRVSGVVPETISK